MSAHIAMSLTSRVFGLFSTATSDSTATAQTPAPLVHNEIGIAGAIRHARDTHMLEEEEEPRPPYLHV